MVFHDRPTIFGYPYLRGTPHIVNLYVFASTKRFLVWDPALEVTIATFFTLLFRGVLQQSWRRTSQRLYQVNLRLIVQSRYFCVSQVGETNPLFFWFQLDYLRSPAKNQLFFLCKVSKNGHVYYGIYGRQVPRLRFQMNRLDLWKKHDKICRSNQFYGAQKL